MKPEIVSLFGACLLVLSQSATADAQTQTPTAAIGRYRAETGALAGEAIRVRPQGASALALEIRGRGVIASGPRQPEDDGSWSFTLRPAQREGLSARLSGGTKASFPGDRLSLRLTRQGNATLILWDGESRVEHSRLRRSRRVLAIASWEDGHSDGRTFKLQALRVVNYYESKGISGEVFEAHGVTHLVERLLLSESRGVTYDRVVFVGHGGWDGPILGTGYDAEGKEISDQASNQYEQEHWERFVDAVARATTPQARIFVSSCHAGGSNHFEYVLEDNNHYVWVNDLAQRTGRIVAGPAGITNSAWTLQAVKAALEGEGVVAQETAWASPDGWRRIGYKRALDSAPLRSWSRLSQNDQALLSAR